MVTKTTFKKKFPDVKVQKLQNQRRIQPAAGRRNRIEDVRFSRYRTALLQLCKQMDNRLYLRENENGTGLNETGF